MFLFAILFIVWVRLENLINISSNLLPDVKALFALLFLECVISIVFSVFSVFSFATNKLHLNSIRSIESCVLRALLLILLFIRYKPKLYYIGLVSVLMTGYCTIYNLYYTRKLLPFINISCKNFDFSVVKTLLSSGVWSLITKLGALLNEGLDLLITNIFIDPFSMGILSLAKTIPGMIGSIIGTMVEVFSPNFTILYAQNKIDELVISVRQSMKIMGVISNIPIIILIVCGKRFFELWQPTQDASQLHLLSIMTCAGFILNGGINCVFNIFVVVNKLKVNSLSVIISGAINVLVVFILLKTTNLGIYAVAGISTIITVIRNIIVIIPYSARCLGLKWNAFYPEAFRSVLFACLSSIICCLITNIFTGDNWLIFILTSLSTAVVSVIIGGYIMLSKKDREVIEGLLFRRRHGQKNI